MILTQMAQMERKLRGLVGSEECGVWRTFNSRLSILNYKLSLNIIIDISSKGTAKLTRPIVLLGVADVITCGLSKSFIPQRETKTQSGFFKFYNQPKDNEKK